MNVPALDTTERPFRLEGARDGLSDEPIVLLRLCLMVADGAGGQERLVSSLLKKLSMPLALVGPDVQIAIDLRGEPHVFRPTGVIWDEMHRACIIEVAWVLPDGATADDLVSGSGTWLG